MRALTVIGTAIGIGFGWFFIGAFIGLVIFEGLVAREREARTAP